MNRPTATNSASGGNDAAQYNAANAGHRVRDNSPSDLGKDAALSANDDNDSRSGKDVKVNNDLLACILDLIRWRQPVPPSSDLGKALQDLLTELAGRSNPLRFYLPSLISRLSKNGKTSKALEVKAANFIRVTRSIEQSDDSSPTSTSADSSFEFSKTAPGEESWVGSSSGEEEPGPSDRVLRQREN